MKRHIRVTSALAALFGVTALQIAGCGATGSSGGDGTGLLAPGAGTGSGGSGGSGGDASGGGGSSGSGNSSGGSSGSSPGGSSGGSGGNSSGTSSGSSGGSSSGDSSTPPTPHGASTCLQAGSGDYSKAGPYAVTTKSVDLASLLSGAATPTTYTIFYPTNMEANCPHPIIAWGNGTGVTGSNVYAFFNNNAASWGMVVAASDNSNVGSGAYNKAGIDYLLAQNKDSTSVFYGKLSTRAGMAGHSQGAIGATAATQHPNCEAEVQVEGGGNPKQGIAFLALSGSADTVVTTGPPTASYGAATGPAMLAVYTGADHTTTPTLGGYVQGNAGTIQFMRFYTAWFRCFLGDDATACRMFKGGSSCGVCKDANWTTMQTKNM
jgi:hypothetical protein